MKLIDLLNKELNEMASITNAEAVAKLIKAGKISDAVAEMLKEKQLKVVPGNLSTLITPQEKAAFSAELKSTNPSAKRGPGAKAATTKIQQVVDSTSGEKSKMATSSQKQEVIKKKLINLLIKTTKAVQSDTKLTDEEKKSNNEALEILKDALLVTMNTGKGLLSTKKNDAKSKQIDIAKKYLAKNSPEALEMVKEIEAEDKEAEQGYIEKVKKEEGRDTTSKKDIDTAFNSGLLKHITKVKIADDLDKRIGTDNETISKEIEKEDKESQAEFNKGFAEKIASTSKEKIAKDKFTEKKRAQARLDQATKKGGTEKQLANLKTKAEGAAEVSKMATTDLVKDVWKKRQATKKEDK